MPMPRVKAQDEPTYDVRFRSEDLWPNSAEPALIHVGVFQSYLTRGGAPARRCPWSTLHPAHSPPPARPTASPA